MNQAGSTPQEQAMIQLAMRNQDANRRVRLAEIAAKGNGGETMLQQLQAAKLMQEIGQNEQKAYADVVSKAFPNEFYAKQFEQDIPWLYTEMQRKNKKLPLWEEARKNPEELRKLMPRLTDLFKLKMALHELAGLPKEEEIDLSDKRIIEGINWKKLIPFTGAQYTGWYDSLLPTGVVYQVGSKRVRISRSEISDAMRRLDDEIRHPSYKPY
jgi:chromosome segregation and condensation protein ScpB